MDAVEDRLYNSIMARLDREDEKAKMERCACGRYMINLDPKKNVCDVCFYRSKYEKALEKIKKMKGNKK
jgi:hypothetical protein